MKKYISIFLICYSILSIVSCNVGRQTVTTPTRPLPRYDRQIIAHLSRQFGVPLTTTDNVPLYHACSDWLGVRYWYGGNTKAGVDCSGFVGNIYSQFYRIKLERNSGDILRRNCVAVSRNNLREGDLVFFNTTGSRQSRVPNHVGIYLKNGKFVHASTSRGVIVSNLSEAYYAKAWLTGGRVRR